MMAKLTPSQAQLLKRLGFKGIVRCYVPPGAEDRYGYYIGHGAVKGDHGDLMRRDVHGLEKKGFLKWADRDNSLDVTEEGRKWLHDNN